LINTGMNNIDQTLTDLSKVLKELVDAAHQPVSQEVTQFLEFRAKKGGDNFGKGVIWSGQGHTKQIVFNGNPDRFFFSESIDLDKDRNITIGGTKVIDGKELGPTITKSNLQQVGRLKGLIVDGSININQYLIYNGATDRLGLGTEAPNAALSVAENSIEVMLGTTDDFHGMVGTFASTDFDIVTDNTARISVKANGNIDLGNPNRNPIQVKVNGKLSIGVNVPDPSVDLHVAGPVRFNGHIQMYAATPPTEGTYAVGDIIWNSSPRVGVGVGWVCLRAGSPGSWYPFGEIKERG
jgi:hypothetical protein